MDTTHIDLQSIIDSFKSESNSLILIIGGSLEDLQRPEYQNCDVIIGISTPTGIYEGKLLINVDFNDFKNFKKLLYFNRRFQNIMFDASTIKFIQSNSLLQILYILVSILNESGELFLPNLSEHQNKFLINELPNNIQFDRNTEELIYTGTTPILDKIVYRRFFFNVEKLFYKNLEAFESLGFNIIPNEDVYPLYHPEYPRNNNFYIFRFSIPKFNPYFPSFIFNDKEKIMKAKVKLFKEVYGGDSYYDKYIFYKYKYLQLRK